ncbi:nucleotidyltransferase domain-containing protein [Pseudomonas piscis]|uniref:Nucleotidyltransferase domain-containing protein n=1 Tax=Pseudomonas piscis TaxID=2614538 RepID=A0ABY9NJR8_9PSED|nr:nucleotidyltransferase domain-containing protein [Pseudomonas piscis]WMN18766.1 nucleotidyltransferase domain-containing protein [Pseudomonas piscis]
MPTLPRPSWKDQIAKKHAQASSLAVSGKLSLKNIVTGLSEFFNDENILTILLGGSYSKGKARPYSDVDIYIIKRSCNIPFYRKATIIDGIPYELNFIQLSYYESVIEGMKKSRRASLVYSLAFAKILKGEEYANNIQTLALEVWKDTTSNAVHIERLISGINESIIGNMTDFMVENDVINAQVVITAVINDCYSLLSLAATGWMHRGRHAVAAINHDSQARILFDDLLLAYRGFLLEDEKTKLADVVSAIVELAEVRWKIVKI